MRGTWRRHSSRRTTCGRCPRPGVLRCWSRPVPLCRRRSISSTGWCFPAARISIPRSTQRTRIRRPAGVIRERDDFELELMRAALERDVPVLAICRGSQVLNVALGGDIEQHVPDRVGTELHREVPGVFSEHRRVCGGRDAPRVDPGRPSRREVASPPGVRLARGGPLARPPAHRTERWKPWRTQRAASPWASCGIQKRARTGPCSRRWWQRPGRIGPRAAS